MTVTRISNYDDIIDSRSVIARIEELSAIGDEAPYRDEDEEAEYVQLVNLDQQGRDYAPDWEYGTTLIRDSYFGYYAQELADDLGLVPSDAWPLSCIDWKQAARELRMDYTSVDFDGVTYWVR